MGIPGHLTAQLSKLCTVRVYAPGNCFHMQHSKIQGITSGMDAVKDTHGKIDFVFHKIILGKVELMKLWKMNHSENRVPPAEDHSLQSYSAIVVGLCDNRVWIDGDLCINSTYFLICLCWQACQKLQVLLLRSDKTQYSHMLPEFKEICSMFHQWLCCWLWVLHGWHYDVMIISLKFNLSGDFSMKRCLIYSTLLSINWDEHFFPFILLMCVLSRCILIGCRILAFQKEIPVFHGV